MAVSESGCIAKVFSLEEIHSYLQYQMAVNESGGKTNVKRRVVN